MNSPNVYQILNCFIFVNLLGEITAQSSLTTLPTTADTSANETTADTSANETTMIFTFQTGVTSAYPTGTPKAVFEDCCQGSTYCSDQNSQCKACICTCKDGYVFSLDLSTSERKKSCLFVTGNLPNSPCMEKADCVEGLECLNQTCRCPFSCEYEEDKLACDCGLHEKRPIIGPICIGVFLGLLIVLFWFWQIRDLIRKHKAERNRVRSLGGPTPAISTLGAVYGTQNVRITPVKSSNFYSSPYRGPHTVAPAPAPLQPVFNSYGDNLAAPSYVPGQPLTPPPAYSYVPPKDSDFNHPFASMAQEESFESDSQADESQGNQNASRENASPTRHPCSAPPGRSREADGETKMRHPLSARF